MLFRCYFQILFQLMSILFCWMKAWLEIQNLPKVVLSGDVEKLFRMQSKHDLPELAKALHLPERFCYSQCFA